MITQEYTQGKHKIKVEVADSIEDAKANNFHEGEYSRYYINGKRVDNYMAMMRFVVEETKNNRNSLALSPENIQKTRKELFQKQKSLFQEQLAMLKKQYKDMPENIMSDMTSYLEKLDPAINIRNME
jgi:FtsZ-binding cell division protein ZapB